MMVNPLLSEALGSIVRSILKVGAGFLVAKGVWTEADAASYVTAAALVIVGLGWSYWTTYHSRLKLVTALASASPMSEATAETRVSAGNAPSVTTPKTVVPG